MAEKTAAPAPPAAKAKQPPKKKSIPDAAEIEAKRQARAEKKKREEELKQQQQAQGVVVPTVDAKGRPLYRPRPWASVGGCDVGSGSASGRPRIKVLSWNILAQALVRRKLFPGSDAMRWSDRAAGLAAELVGHGWDVGCFQEVDRLPVHAQTLQDAGYSHLYAKGNPLKQHGLLLAWRNRPRSTSDADANVVFESEPIASHVLSYDDALVDGTEPSHDDPSAADLRRGCSRITRNIALFAAIKFKQQHSSPSTSAASTSPAGVILATTHLFWHPMHAYERTRQAGILARALDRFRRQVIASTGQNVDDSDAWPTILAGDFNDQPHSASYALLTGRPLDDHARAEIRQSSVVHQSIDERRERRRQSGAAAAAGAEAEADADDDGEGEGEEEAEEQGGADDQMLKNCRAAQPTDGLLTLAELEQLYDLSREPPSPRAGNNSEEDSAAAASDGASARLALRSAYATGYHRLSSPDERDNLFSSPSRGRERWDDPTWQPGDLNVHRHLFEEAAAAGSSGGGGGPGAEPMWTLYSPLFGLTLDFIFLFPSLRERGRTATEEGVNNADDALYPRVTQLLRTHRTDVLTSKPHESSGAGEQAEDGEGGAADAADADTKAGAANGQAATTPPLPGLPRKGVCVSDHVAIGAELEL